ncbi:MAG: twin-arginine translocase TatA/TatE family subunit [Candidatus Acidiferrales bacterium]
MLSVPHLIVIFVVALVIFGPEKLPDLARNLGKLMAEFRRTTTDLRGTFETHLRDLERETSDRRIDTPRPPVSTPAPPADTPEAAANPEIVAAPGTVQAASPHNVAVPLGDSDVSSQQNSANPFDDPLMYTDDPEELIRQAEAQIARERAEEEVNPERVSDGTIGKP